MLRRNDAVLDRKSILVRIENSIDRSLKNVSKVNVRCTPTLAMFGWVGFYGISTIVGYLMPNPLYTYILDT